MTPHLLDQFFIAIPILHLLALLLSLSYLSLFLLLPKLLLDGLPLSVLEALLGLFFLLVSCDLFLHHLDIVFAKCLLLLPNPVLLF